MEVLGGLYLYLLLHGIVCCVFGFEGLSNLKIINISSDVFARGARATNCQPTAGGILCPNGPSKSTPDTISSTVPFSSAVSGTIQASLHSEVTKRPLSSDGSHSMTPVKPLKQYNSMDSLSSAGEKTLASDVSLAPKSLNNQLSSLQLARDSDRGSCITMNRTTSVDTSAQSCSFSPAEAIIAANEEVQNLSSELSSVNIHRNAQDEYYGPTKPTSPPSDCVLVKSSQSQVLQCNANRFSDATITNAAGKAATSDGGVFNSKEQCDLRLDSQPQVVSSSVEVEDDVAYFDNQRLKDPEVVCHSYLPKSASFGRVSNHSSPHPLHHGEPCTVVNSGSLSSDNKVGDESLSHASNILCNGYPQKLVGTSSYGLLHDERNEQCSERLVNGAVNSGSDVAMDMGESSIISNILSMEFDAWDDSLTSPLNLTKLLGENTDNQNVPLKKSSSWKVQSNNQSRFSFARQEESKIQAFDVHPSYDASQQFPKSRPLIQDFADRDLSMDKLGIANGFVANSLEEFENPGSGHFVASSNKLSGEY